MKAGIFGRRSDMSDINSKHNRQKIFDS